MSLLICVSPLGFFGWYRRPSYRRTSRANSMAGRPSGFTLAICALFHYAALVNVGSASSGGGVFVCVCGGEEMADIGY